MNVTFDQPTEETIKFLFDHLREADKRELEAATGAATFENMWESVCWSEVCLVVSVEEKPIMVFGAAEVIGDRWGIWMLGTDAIASVSRLFLRRSVETLKALFEVSAAASFINYTHADNHVHQRWLEWCGAELMDPIPYGAKNELFRPFIIRRENLCVN